MWFWWFMLLSDSLLPAIMIIVGRLMWKHYPKKINRAVGYKSKRSMKNMDTWIFAHEYIGRLWWRMGWIILPLTILAHIPFFRADDDTIGSLSIVLIVIQCVLTMGAIILTEKALKENFDEDKKLIH